MGIFRTGQTQIEPSDSEKSLSVYNYKVLSAKHSLKQYISVVILRWHVYISYYYMLLWHLFDILGYVTFCGWNNIIFIL